MLTSSSSQIVEPVANRKNFRFSLTGWLLLALVFHLLLVRQLPPDFWYREQAPLVAPSITVMLQRQALPSSSRPEIAEPQPATPETVTEPPVEEEAAVPSRSPSPMPAKAPPRPPASREKILPKAPADVPSSQVAPARPSRIDASRLKEAIRSYRLPEQADRPFSPMRPPDVTAGAFEENTLARVNRRIHQYDGHGGAEVVRIRRFGKKDRCFLVHRVGFNVEREDWDPGMDTMVGWGADEIPCE